MGRKVLAVKSELCNGCRICVLAWARQRLGAVSLAETPLRIQSDGDKFIVSADAGLNEEDQKIMAGRCLRGCLTIKDEN